MSERHNDITASNVLHGLKVNIVDEFLSGLKDPVEKRRTIIFTVFMTALLFTSYALQPPPLPMSFCGPTPAQLRQFEQNYEREKRNAPKIIEEWAKWADSANTK